MNARSQGALAGDGPQFAPPIKERLRAWWHGYELAPSRRTTSGTRNNRRSVGGRNGRNAAGHDAGAAESPFERPPSPWSPARCQLAEELWTPGFVVPGGTRYVEKLVSGCSLSEAETLLEIGVGMGGCSRTIIGKFQNYIVGYEPDEKLAAAARHFAIIHGIDDRLEVIDEPLETISPQSGYFRAALLRDILYTVEDKADLLGRIAKSLKPGESQVVVTDFLCDPKVKSAEFDAWASCEDGQVHPWTDSDLVQCILSLGMTPRIIQDDSGDYLTLVSQAWAEYLAIIEAASVPEDARAVIAREAEIWSRRVAALKSGALRHYRLEGVKNL